MALLRPLWSLLCWVVAVRVAHGQMDEGDRVAEYHRRNYTWPLTQFVPNTQGWTKLNTERLGQVQEMEGLVRYFVIGNVVSFVLGWLVVRM